MSGCDVVWLVIGPRYVHAVYDNRQDADEDVDIREGRGGRHDLIGHYHVESWMVLGDDSVAHRARLAARPT